MTPPTNKAQDLDNYQKIQSIYLDWHDRRRPLSGFVREIESLIANQVAEKLQSYDQILNNGWNAERLHSIIKEDLATLKGKEDK